MEPDRVLLGQVGSESGSGSEKIAPDPDLRTDPTILRFDINFFAIFAYLLQSGPVRLRLHTYPLRKSNTALIVLMQFYDVQELFTPISFLQLRF